MIKTKLVYFKPSGKMYHYVDIYRCPVDKNREVFAHVRTLLRKRELPELKKDHNNYIVFCEPEDHYPILIREHD